MLLGLMILAYSGMAYFVVGMWKNITKPMDDKKVVEVSRWIERWALLTNLIAYACLGYFLFVSKYNGYFVQQLRDFFSSEACFVLVVSSAAKFLCTTLAGVDFMIGEIVSQRRFETYLEYGGQDAIQWSREYFDSKGERDNVQKLMKDRNQRLDELVLVSRSGATDRRCWGLGFGLSCPKGSWCPEGACSSPRCSCCWVASAAARRQDKAAPAAAVPPGSAAASLAAAAAAPGASHPHATLHDMV